MSKRISVEFGDFAWSRLKAEAARQSVSAEELVRHAVLYFLADADSGRLSRQIPTEEPGEAGGNQSQV